MADSNALPRTHAELDWRGERVSIRDLAVGDVPAIVDYWARADDAFIARLGVDRTRLGTGEAMAKRFAALVPTGDPDQARLGFAIAAGGRLIGYTNLNRYGPRDNVSHWHLIDPAARGGGLSTALYPVRLETYFGCTGIEALTHQTRTGNLAMNRVLDHYLPVAATSWLDSPDGLAAPGEFNIRHVSRSDLPRIVEIGRRLRTQMSAP